MNWEYLLGKTGSSIGKIFDQTSVAWDNCVLALSGSTKRIYVCAADGTRIELEISNEGLGEYLTYDEVALEHNMRVYDADDECYYTVIGIGPKNPYDNSGEKVIWIILDGEDGVSFLYPENIARDCVVAPL